MKPLAQHRRWECRYIRAERFDKRLVRHDRLFVAPPVEHDRSACRGAARELGRERRLAHPRLPCQQHDLLGAFDRGRQCPLQQFELAFTSRELLGRSGEAGKRHRQIARECFQRRQRRELVVESGDRQLKDVLRTLQPA